MIEFFTPKAIAIIKEYTQLLGGGLILLGLSMFFSKKKDSKKKRRKPRNYPVISQNKSAVAAVQNSFTASNVSEDRRKIKAAWDEFKAWMNQQYPESHETMTDAVECTGIIDGNIVVLWKVRPAKYVRYDKLKSQLQQLSGLLGVRDDRIRVTQGDAREVYLEIPKEQVYTIFYRDVVNQASTGRNLDLILGIRPNGLMFRMDLASMPHMIVAGVTGGGKSAFINTILDQLTRKPADYVRFMLLDVKEVELSPWQSAPHCIGQVETELEPIVKALKWLETEMDRRYSVLADAGVRSIDKLSGNMPRIVVMIEEVADLMQAQKPVKEKVESSIQRLAQKARASGIYLVLITQRPSTNVLTGVIKGNIRHRVCFNVATGVDSRVVLDELGAEALHSYGDALMKTNRGAERLHTFFFDDDEVKARVEELAKLPRELHFPKFDKPTNTPENGHLQAISGNSQDSPEIPVEPQDVDFKGGNCREMSGETFPEPGTAGNVGNSSGTASGIVPPEILATAQRLIDDGDLSIEMPPTKWKTLVGCRYDTARLARQQFLSGQLQHQ